LGDEEGFFAEGFAGACHFDDFGAEEGVVFLDFGGFVSFVDDLGAKVVAFFDESVDCGFRIGESCEEFIVFQRLVCGFVRGWCRRLIFVEVIVCFCGRLSSGSIIWFWV
jgi:hypothetical protein